MKIIFRLIALFLIVITFLISYLTFIGFETQKFNSEIIKKVKKINNNFEVELKDIKILLDPLNLKLHAKTIAPKLKNKNKTIEIESIKTQIPLTSFFNEKFIIENLEISTKTLEIKSLISFIRVFNNTPEFYILEKLIKKGILVADLKLNFDSDGNLIDDYEIKGFVKNTKINIFKKYKIDKLNFIFSYNSNILNVKDLSLRLNDLNLISKNLILEEVKNKFLIKGEIENKDFNLNSNNIQLIKSLFQDIDIKRLKFNSKNTFSVYLDKKLKFDNFKLKSEIEIEEFSFPNKFKLGVFFPKINEDIKFLNHKLKINYKKNEININGNGDILLQDKKDKLTYSIKKINKLLDFKTSLQLKDTPLMINFLDYEKSPNENLVINIEGSKRLNDIIKLDYVSLNEKNNKLKLEGLVLNKKFKITDLKKAQLNYLDKKNIYNKLSIISKKNFFLLSGDTFNVDSLIDKLIKADDKSDIILKNFKLKLNIDKLFLDKYSVLNNFEGDLSFNNHEIKDGNLVGYFSNNKKFNLTINSNGDEKITTLFLDNAEPIIKRYKFIKGFEEGTLDYYSAKKDKITVSTLKIYDFKLKELPALTKLLTLASLQGIADLLSGEGIRFNEFEMNFRNEGSLMTIDEIYAIGPAISILMNGYIEKDKLISLRGTLVPATTLNKVIGSIPFFGNILVGKKTGEGVFGVSFKIKGPPKNLETTVNPIKTLTPRFITRTLEKIKKN